jgi:hypothetical protein
MASMAAKAPKVVLELWALVASGGKEARDKKAYSLLHIISPCARLTLGFTCKARLNDRSRSDRTSAPCLVQAVVLRRPRGLSHHDILTSTECSFLHRARIDAVALQVFREVIAIPFRGAEQPHRMVPWRAHLASREVDAELMRGCLHNLALFQNP